MQNFSAKNFRGGWPPLAAAHRSHTHIITRRATGHMAFGTGIHGCAGQMMARLEGEIVLTALARRVASIRLDGEPVQHFNNTVRGLKSMPVTVEPLLAAVH